MRKGYMWSILLLFCALAWCMSEKAYAYHPYETCYEERPVRVWDHYYGGWRYERDRFPVPCYPQYQRHHYDPIPLLNFHFDFGSRHNRHHHRHNFHRHYPGCGH